MTLDGWQEGPLVTPPSGSRSVAEAKLIATEKRIVQGMQLLEWETLAGVQQGGQFLYLRHRAVSRLRDLGTQYLALGSLVPFRA